MIVTQKELASCLGVSQRHVQRLQAEGIIHRDTVEKGYNLETCVQAYISYKIESGTARNAQASKEEIQAEHERVKMEISKLKLRRMRREVLEASSVEKYWTDAVIRIRNKIMSLPSKIVMSISGEGMSNQIAIVTNILEGALDELADYDPDLLEDGGIFEDEDEDEDEDE